MKTHVLLVEESRGHSEMLALALSYQGIEVIMRLSVDDDIQKHVLSCRPNVLIVTLKSPNQAILNQLEMLYLEYPLPIVMFVDESERELIDATIKAGVSAFIVDGMNAKRVKSIIDVAIARHEQHNAIRVELAKTRLILQDRKIIEKAKGIIMQKRHMSEEDAYAALRKLAMKQNKRISSVAQELVGMADLLL